MYVFLFVGCIMNDLVRIIFAIFLPPLGVFLEVGLTKHFWINVVLTLIGYLPGILHALYIITTRDGHMDLPK